MKLPEGTTEPPIESWIDIPLSLFVDRVRREASARQDSDSLSHPLVIALDGRSGAGKTTFARLLTQELGAAPLGADDIAWYAPMFGWADLAREGILEPLRAGRSVDFKPPAWTEQGREGSIVVPANVNFVVFEGVGSSQEPLGDLVDYRIWVQSDAQTARRFGLARDIEDGTNGDAEESVRFWDDWDEQEREFFEKDRPWERADLVIAGNSDDYAPQGSVRIATF